MATEPYHHGNLRQALLDAAETLLADSGPDEISIRAVAKAVGVSHNAPYRHFESRDALLAGLAQRGFEHLVEAFSAGLEGITEPREKMMAVSKAYVGFAARNPSIYLLMFNQVLNRLASPELKKASGASLKVVYDVVVELRGEADAEFHVRGAWAMVHGIALLLIEDRLLYGSGTPEGLLELAMNNYIIGMLSS
jgi:AcrR family transcriptional regulator